MVTAGLVTGAAHAADPISLSISGYYTAMGVFTDGDDKTGSADANARDDEVKQEGEIIFSGSTTLDNGMSAGVAFHLEADNGAGEGDFDETYAWVEGGYGRVVIGAEASAPFQMHYTAPYFVASHGVDSPNFQHTSNVSSRTATYITLTGDRNKVSYFTPRINGFQLGVSYTPDTGVAPAANAAGNANPGVGGQAGGVDNSFGAAPTDNGGTFEQVFEVGLNWNGEYEGVGIGISGGYMDAEVEPTGTTPSNLDPEAYSIGLNLTSGGFTLGGAWYESEDLFTKIGTSSVEEEAWSVGLQYVTGPWTLGVGYFESETDLTATTETEFEVTEIGATYALGPGVDVFAVVDLYENDSTGAAAGSFDTDTWGSVMGGLIWLASYPKSGNTWMRAFLHNLLRNPPSPAHINDLDKFCLGESGADWYQPKADKPLLEMTSEELAQLRPIVHREMTKAHPDSVFVKTHNYLGEWCGVPLHTMDVTAGAIYVVRNPIDVAVSMTDHFGLDLDGAIDRLAHDQAATENQPGHIPEIHSSWSTHVSSWTAAPNPQLHVVRYEDLTDHPRKTFKGVANFLGLKPKRDRLDKAIRFSSFKVLKAQEDKDDFKERSEHAKSFFRSGKVGDGRDQLTAAQIDRIINDHHDQMARFGYLPK
ncbi:STD2 [Symbiodinium microadriaticum]|nr:STD2 [Symbiodinium microadriaticum]